MGIGRCEGWRGGGVERWRGGGVSGWRGEWANEREDSNKVIGRLMTINVTNDVHGFAEILQHYYK